MRNTCALKVLEVLSKRQQVLNLLRRKIQKLEEAAAREINAHEHPFIHVVRDMVHRLKSMPRYARKICRKQINWQFVT